MTVVALPEVADLTAILRENPPFLDVRAPLEFAQGAFPHAVNLPLLTDDERAKVGTCYKHHGQAAALDLGYRLVSVAERARRVVLWADFARREPTAYLYCWRGGLRSRLVQEMLAEAGVVVRRIRWGYKGLRRAALDLIARCEPTQFLVLSGRTGSGKTRLLRRLSAAIDLEHLAHHRGSGFGSRATKQPTQIHFENHLAIALVQSSASVRVVEDESRLIGRLSLPDGLFHALSRSPVVVLEADLAARIDFSLQEYVVDALAEFQAIFGPEAGFLRFAQHLRDSLQRIARRLGGLRYQQLRGQLDEAITAHERAAELAGYRPLIHRLLVEYYDPMYDYQLAQKAQRVIFRGDALAITHWLHSQGIH